MKRGWAMVLAVVVILGLLPGKAKGVELELKAKSALLMDAATGTVLYEHNAHEPLAPASVTKVMTMLLIMEAIDSGNIGWEDMVTASEVAAQKGGSQIYLKVGEQMSVRDMLKAIAVSSANDCACAMAEHIAGSEAAFVDRMNQRAAQLGMQNTRFVNCTGLDDSEEAKDHKTSAYDIALMSRQLLTAHPAIKDYTTIWMDTVRGGTFGLANTNKLVRFYSGATGLKTGFTSGAGYCLSASAQRDGMELVAVVMGCETSAERFAACKGMLDYGFAQFALVIPKLPEPARVPVKLGEEDYVNLGVAQQEPLLIDKSQRSSVTVEMELEPVANAPVSQGQALGMLTIKAGEQILRQIPLVARQAVPKLSWGSIFRQVLRQLIFAR